MTSTRRHLRLLQTLLVALAALLPGIAAAAGGELIGHDLDVRIHPERGTLSAEDRLSIPGDGRPLTFWLHTGLDPKVTAGNAVIERIGRDGHLERFRLTPRSGEPVTLSYGGRIRHDMQEVREGMGRSRQQSVGTIAPDGVFLNGYSGWYPGIPDRMLHFDLTVTLPPGWLAVSQGAGPEIEDTGRERHIHWSEQHPQDEIQLSAARFKLYRAPTPYGEAQVYLRLPDDALAQRYLDATADYLARYSDLIGAYPYAKFALVENFWETGYGMPSFTLLGSRVLRLPFILHSSYPHEILHNWWGNGVFVDYASGNWSEGLTAYLADHLNQELAGQGAAYRRDQLKAYADYVRDGEDFPLTAFRGRHGSASQAIGYGKMLMTAHMLRVLLGDDDFLRGLRRFYQDNLFRVADFDDLRVAFEVASNHDLSAFFSAWTERPGAPELKLGDINVEHLPNGSWQVAGSIYQIQGEPAFPLTVPVVIHPERGRPREVLAAFDNRTARFETTLPAAPVRVAVDPRFDSFRKLAPGESPVALSNLLGAGQGLMVLPADASPALRDGYRALADAWRQGHPDWQITSDAQIEALPEDLPVWLFGWENRLLADFDAASDAFTLDPETRQLTLAVPGGADREQQPADGNQQQSVALTARRGDQPLGWVATTVPGALPGLARKLPHYGKYGYLTFSGSAPDNRLKGQWPANDSALMQWLTDDRPPLPLPPRPPLMSAPASAAGG